jgi:hypothetical protein
LHEQLNSDRRGEERFLDRVPGRLVAADPQTGLVDRHRHERV